MSPPDCVSSAAPREDSGDFSLSSPAVFDDFRVPRRVDERERLLVALTFEGDLVGVRGAGLLVASAVTLRAGLLLALLRMRPADFGGMTCGAEEYRFEATQMSCDRTSRV